MTKKEPTLDRFPTGAEITAAQSGRKAKDLGLATGKEDILAPSIGLLCKLGSIIVHAEEGAGADGHEFDWIALRQLLADPEVRGWIEAMTAKGFLPVKRAREG